MDIKVFLRISIGFLSLLFLNLPQMVWAQSEAQNLIKDLRQIHTPNGIEVLEKVVLNGREQWINIRGKDKSNPVLLVLHGGPASPLMPTSWAYQTPWEDFFTVVHWDQRGAGKNWTESDTVLLAEELSFRQVIQDAYVLVDTLRDRFHQEKVFLMGYSYGASIGIRMASRIPQKIYAYIGVGQTSPQNPEKLIFDRLLELTSQHQDTLAIQELNAIAPYPNLDGSTPLRKMMTVRKWARKYNGGWYGKPDMNLYFDLPKLSPEYSSQDFESLATSTSWITRKLFAKGPEALFPYEFQIPVIFLMGKHDLHTPYSGAKSYWDSISSPKKRFVSFEYSGHMPFLEEQGKFLMTLVQEVLPFAQHPEN